MRELDAMARGRQEAEWSRFAEVISHIRNVAYGEWEDPARWNPFAETPVKPAKTEEDLRVETGLAINLLRSMAR